MVITAAEGLEAAVAALDWSPPPDARDDTPWLLPWLHGKRTGTYLDVPAASPPSRPRPPPLTRRPAARAIGDNLGRAPMREYSPRRRTALVLTGSGTSGAYHAGVLKALDESGVKLDLVVGSGVGAVGAAFGAAAGGSRLYGERGFWSDVSWDAFFRLRPALRVAILLLACSFGVFLLPVVLALVAGLLFPLVLIAGPRLAGMVRAARPPPCSWRPSLLRAPYLAALVPAHLLPVRGRPPRPPAAVDHAAPPHRARASSGSSTRARRATASWPRSGRSRAGPTSPRACRRRRTSAGNTCPSCPRTSDSRASAS